MFYGQILIPRGLLQSEAFENASSSRKSSRVTYLFLEMFYPALFTIC